MGGTFRTELVYFLKDIILAGRLSEILLCARSGSESLSAPSVRVPVMVLTTLWLCAASIPTSALPFWPRTDQGLVYYSSPWPS